MFHGAATIVRAFFNATPPTLANGEGAPLQSDSSGNLKISNAAMGSTTDAAQTDPSSAGSVIAFLKGLLTGLGRTTDAKLQDGGTSGSLLAHVKGINEAANATTPVNVTLNGAASGTLARHRIALAGTTNAQSVKASAGQIYQYDLGNFSATAFVVKFSDLAAAPTPGTTPVVWSVYVPAAGRSYGSFPAGIPFTVGIAYCVTRGAADSDTTATAANDGYINIGYV